MPTKSNNTGGQGGKRPGAGRKPKGVKEKADNGNTGGRRLKVLDIPDTEGSVMPQPDEILSAKQKDGTKLKAAEIYERVWKWLDNLGATANIAPEVIEQYAMCRTRWLQCEDMTNELGFLSRHPTTGKPITSPFINIGINYMNQAARQWDAIMQTVKENCSVDFTGANPNDDLEKILHQRKGFDAFSCMEKVMADDASIYVFHADTEGLNFRKAFNAAGFYLSGCCIWKKPSLVLGRSPYQWQHEPCRNRQRRNGDLSIAVTQNITDGCFFLFVRAISQFVH